MTATQISRVNGRRQVPALRSITTVAWILAGIGIIGDAPPFAIAGIAAIALVALAPLFRVGWLMFRWVQESDWRFVWTAAALFGVIAVAGLIALLGR